MEEDNRQDKQEVVEPKREDDKSSSKKAISIFIAVDIFLVIIIIILLLLKSCKDNNQESNNNNKEPEIDLVRFNRITDVFKGIVKKNMEFNLYADDSLDKVIAVSCTDNYPNNFSLNISISSGTEVYYCTITEYEYDGNKEQYTNFLDYLLLDSTTYTAGKGSPTLNSTIKTDIRITTDKVPNRYVVSENEHDPADRYIDGFYKDNDNFYVYSHKTCIDGADPFANASDKVINSESPLYDYYRGLLIAWELCNNI